MLDLTPFHHLFTLSRLGLFSTNNACNQIDRNPFSSLAFNHMSSPPLNWSSIDCCQWEGISCDPKCQVTHIWLPSKGLSGSISHSLGNLTHLSHPNLSHNLLSGPLPKGLFSSLNQLKVLDLSYNHLFGDISGWPTSIQIVDISSNHFSEKIKSSFLQRAWRLTKLTVSNNSFMGPIPSFPCINSSLVWLLDFSHNHHSGHIHSGLGACSKLKVFRAGFNSLSGLLPHDVYNATGFRFLSGDDTIVGTNAFENLQLFSFKKCQLTGQLPIWLARLKKLETLSPRLFHLHLSNNLISGKFPKELCALPALVSPKAIVSNNKLDLPIFSVLPNTSHVMFQVNFLSNMEPGIFVANNSLSGNIPVGISHLKLLFWLDLSDNNFSGSIPHQISELTNLEGLYLSDNWLSDEIPASLSSLHFLAEFSVANNNLHGLIPSGTQLQSFNAFAYEGNPGLCGTPLPHECAHFVSNNRDIRDEDNGHKIPWFRVIVVLGFITGFWGVCGSLVISCKWRVAYFQFMDHLKDRCIMFFFKITYWLF